MVAKAMIANAVSCPVEAEPTPLQFVLGMGGRFTVQLWCIIRICRKSAFMLLRFYREYENKRYMSFFC